MEKSKRYAAKLLFQFRVGRAESNRRRVCEERIIILQASSARRALSAAKRCGKTAQLTYRNVDWRRVQFEFVGVLDLLHLGRECDEIEVWYDIKEMIEPMERRSKLLPSDLELLHPGVLVGSQRLRKTVPFRGVEIGHRRRSRAGQRL
jgi:hypothetical protein